MLCIVFVVRIDPLLVTLSHLAHTFNHFISVFPHFVIASPQVQYQIRRPFRAEPYSFIQSCQTTHPFYPSQDLGCSCSADQNHDNTTLTKDRVGPYIHRTCRYGCMTIRHSCT
jgi:hypothetical protein